MDATACLVALQMHLKDSRGSGIFKAEGACHSEVRINARLLILPLWIYLYMVLLISDTALTIEVASCSIWGGWLNGTHSKAACLMTSWFVVC